jgi:hypothetical protein
MSEECPKCPIEEYKEINQIEHHRYELKELVEKYNMLKQLGASVGIYYEII